MGDERFSAWARDLFGRDQVTLSQFEESVADVLGEGVRSDLHLWLKTTEYPERFRPHR